MDRDRVLYHFSEEGDITYCSGEGQVSLSMALRGLARLPWRGTGFSLPGPTVTWELSNGEGQALALRGLARLPWRGTGFSLPRPTGKWELSGDVFTDETAAPIHRAPSLQ